MPALAQNRQGHRGERRRKAAAGAWARNEHTHAAIHNACSNMHARCTHRSAPHHSAFPSRFHSKEAIAAWPCNLQGLRGGGGGNSGWDMPQGVEASASASVLICPRAATHTPGTRPLHTTRSRTTCGANKPRWYGHVGPMTKHRNHTATTRLWGARQPTPHCIDHPPWTGGHTRKSHTRHHDNDASCNLSAPGPSCSFLGN